MNLPFRSCSIGRISRRRPDLARIGRRVAHAWLLASVMVLALPVSEGNAGSGLEYRFKAPDGMEFNWRDGKVERLESQPFMTTSDFANAIAMKSNNLNAPDAFEIDIVHNKSGRLKYRTITKVDQRREYCILFNKVVLECYVLPAKLAALYEPGGTIYGPFSHQEATALTAQINKLLH
jgi:hypothetical protein